MNLLLFLLATLHQKQVHRDSVCPLLPGQNLTRQGPSLYQKSYSFPVPSRSGGHYIGQVSGFSPWNSKVWYSLVGTDDVMIDIDDGVLRIKSNLSPDRPNHHTFFAVLTDSQFKSATATINVIFSTSSTPRAPSFHANVFRTDISADIGVNTTVLEVMAFGDNFNEDIVYDMSFSREFWIHRTSGIIYTATSPIPGRIYKFTVTAAYRSNTQYTSSATVIVNVFNSNKTVIEGLTYEQSFSTFNVFHDVPRNATVLSTRAISRNPSRQSLVRYYMNGSSSLRINQVTGDIYVYSLPLPPRTMVSITAVLGTISLQKSLLIVKVCNPNVREVHCSADPCMSNGSNLAQNCLDMRNATCVPNYCGGCHAEYYKNGARVSCHADTRNERPVFLTPPYRMSVAVDKKLYSALTKVHAFGTLGETVRYQVANTTHISIDNITGVLYLTTATPVTHTFSVIAAFLSRPSDTTVTSFHLTVIPQGQLSLAFEKPWYQVSDNFQNGSTIATLRAVASSSARQSEVRYSIRESNSSIGINPVTGEAYARRLLSPGRTIVTVQAAISNITTLTALDIEQELAVQPQPLNLAINLAVTTVYVHENNPRNIVIASLYNIGITSLPTPRENLTFSLETTFNSTFSVSNEGIIYGNKVLDYETRRLYDLVVNAVLYEGVAVAFKKIRVTVKVLNVNDNAPRFQGIVSPFVVPANLNVGDSVFKFAATDADESGPVYVKHYFIDSDLFDYDPTGVVTLKQRLTAGSRYNITMTASDSGFPTLFTTSSVELVAVSLDSGYPILPYRVAEILVDEEMSDRQLIKTITATGGNISYSIAPGSNEDNFFKVEPSTGNIYTERLIGIEGVRNVSCVVQATNIDNQLSAYVQIFLDIRDINDNPPTWPFSEYRVDLRRDTVFGTEVFRETARDVDENTVITYSVIGPNINLFNPLTVNNTLTINLVGQFPSDVSSFSLSVVAFDGRHSSSTSLQVYLY